MRSGLPRCSMPGRSFSARSEQLLWPAGSLSGGLCRSPAGLPTKGCLDSGAATDPLIYRFYEIMAVYGFAASKM